MMCILLLLACAAVLTSAHRPWDWKNDPEQAIGAFDSSTSTSSTSDSDSTDSRIAKAVEAALRHAQTEDDSDVVETNFPYQKYRLRLSTTNRENTCAFFSCDEEIEQVCADGSTTDVTALEGAVATVTTATGTYDSVFDATGVAIQLDNSVTFTVTYDGCTSFTLTTEEEEDGLVATALTVSTQPTSSDGESLVYFVPTADGSFFDDETFESTDGTLAVANGDNVIGCDATFDDVSSQGYTSFTVTGTNGFVVSNSTDDDDDLTAEFSIAAVMLVKANNTLDGEAILSIGLANLPCATRERVVYDEIAIATLRSSDVDIFDHPLLYDALETGVSTAAPDFENFIFQMQVAAGRTQIRMRDVTLDTGAFSIMSHDSKFTPCFRVYNDADSDVRVYIGLRADGEQVIEAQMIGQGTDNDLVQVSDDGVVSFRDLDGVAEEDLPLITVTEVALDDLTSSTLAVTRPYTRLRSDVSVLVEECPEFTYFQ